MSNVSRLIDMLISSLSPLFFRGLINVTSMNLREDSSFQAAFGLRMNTPYFLSVSQYVSF